MYALKPQGMHLPCNMVLLVFTDATVSTAPVLFSKEASPSGIPSKHIMCMKLSDVCMYLMHIHVQYIIQLWLKYYAFNSTFRWCYSF